MNQLNSQFNLWTSDKTPELTIFYNVAFERLKRFLKKESDLNFDISGHSLELRDAVKTDSFIRNKISEGAYIKLKNYLWKGFLDDKNRSGTTVTEPEKKFICQLIDKLEQIRNYQSHYYHSNSPLLFSAALKGFVQDLFVSAKQALTESHRMELKWFEEKFAEHRKKKQQYDRASEFGELFNKHNGEWFLNREGKNFFLSFFLTTGEMKLFLKQRKGSKRDDGIDFLAKHALYSYYCHRDGAARNRYNQPDSFLEYNKEAAKEILQVRQLFKINTYLNDVPPEYLDPKLFPVVEEEKSDSIEEVLKVVNKKGWFPELVFRLAKKPSSKTELHKKETIEPLIKTLPGIHFKHKEVPDVLFEVGESTFRKIAIEGMRGNGNSIQKATLLFGQEREDIKEFVLHKRLREGTVVQNLISWLEEYPNYKIRSSNDKFRFQLSRWINSFSLGKEVERKLGESLKKKLDEEPVELRLQDFYSGDNRKPRQKDEFMAFSVQYLIDFQEMPEMNFHWQAFEIVKTKEGKQVLTEISCFQPKKPEKKEGAIAEWRLKFTADQQILFTWKQPVPPPEPGRKNKNEDIQPLLIGHKAMRNLMIGLLKHDKKREAQLLFHELIPEVESLYSETQQLKWLDSRFIPTSLDPEKKRRETARFKERFLNRLKYIKSELMENIASPPRQRADRNRIIMECYRLFDWKKRYDGTEQFLRKNEYDQLSIYHYTLETKRLHEILIELKRGQPDRFPHEVSELLKTAVSLDDLYLKTIELTMEKIGGFISALESGVVKTSKLKSFAAKISVPLYDKNENVRRLPFDLHPELLVKGLYERPYSNNKNFNVSKKIWEDERSAVNLRKGYYSTEINEATHSDKRKKDQLGAIRSLVVKDWILLQIAKKYDPNFIQVEDMFQKEISLVPIKDSAVKRPEATIDMEGDNGKPIRIQVWVKYHQLDDHMVLLQADEMRKLVWHYLFIMGAVNTEGKVDRAKLTELEGGEIVKIIDNKGDLFGLPLHGLRRAKEKIFADSLLAASSIFDWEEAIIKSKEKELTSISIQLDESNHLNFKSVLALAGVENVAEINLLNDTFRTTAFHARVPDKWNYDMDIFQKSIFGPGYHKRKEMKADKKQFYTSKGVVNKPVT